MTQNEVAAPAAPVVAKSPSKKKQQPSASKAKKAVATHPTTAVMVTAAIKELNEKKGSSLPAIKKYLAANYKVDSAKLAPFIRKFLKAAVLKGVLVQVNGTGAVGHFKLAVDAKKKPVVNKAVVKKKPVAKKPAAVTPKKRKLPPPAKKPKSVEPAAKKIKKVIAAPKPKLVKPAKSLAKVQKAPATKTKPPKVVKKTLVKKTTTPKKK